MKNYLKKWTKFWQLSFAEKSWFLKAILVLSFIKIGLIVLPFSVFKRLFAFISKKNKPILFNNLEVTKIVVAIQRAAAVLPFPITCLPQALATKFFVRNDPSFLLKIGIQKSPENKIEAHAWVEKQGDIVIGEVISFQFIPLWEWH